MREAESAMRMLNDFDMGQGVRLVVKVSETREAREKRLSKKKDEEAFLSTLRCGRYSTCEEPPVVNNGFEMTDDELNRCQTNPFLPSYKSRELKTASPLDFIQESCGRAGEEVGDMGKQPFTGVAADTASGENKSAVPGLRSCTKCGKGCSQKCQRCRAPYCGRQCQESDWKRHKLECSQQVENSPKPVTEPVVIREKEHSEDEGFEISTPPIEELMDVLQLKPGSLPEGIQRVHTDIPQPNREETKHILSLPIVSPSLMPRSHPPQSTSPSPSTPGSVEQPSPQAAPVSSKQRCSPSEVLETFRLSGGPLPSLPLGCHPPQRLRAVVTSCLSRARFTAVFASVEVKQALTAISQCRDSSHLPPADPLSLVPGSKVGFIDRDGELYRMEVVGVASNLIDLCFHDFGGALSVPISSQLGLVLLPEAVVTIPCLRYRFALQGVSGDQGSSGGGEQLMAAVRGHVVQISDISRGSSSASGGSGECFDCHVHLPNGTDLSSLMAMSLGREQTPSSSLPSAHDNFSSLSQTAVTPDPPRVTQTGQYKLMHMARDVMPHPVPTQTKFVLVPQVVDSPSSIWAHVIHSRLTNLDLMQSDLVKEYGARKKTQVYSPSVGELVVVKHSSDQRFYRAEVLCVNNDGTADVRFVDYGQRETVLVSQVHHIELIFLTLPLQAIHFSMEGVAPAGHALSWSASAIAYLKTKILNRQVEARLLAMQQQVHCVSLSDPDAPDKSLAEEMVSNGWCERSSNGDQASSPSGRMAGVRSLASPCEAHNRPLGQSSPSPSPSRQQLSGDQPVTPKTPPTYSPSLTMRHPSSIPEPAAPRNGHSSPPSPARDLDRSCNNSSKFRGEQSRSPKSKVRVPWLYLPTNTEAEVMVSCATSPAQFHIQRLDQTALTALEELTNTLNSMKLEPFPPFNKSFDFCVARFPEDGLLYRAKVCSKRSGSKITVKFIDYGDLVDIAHSDLYCLPESCASLPAQGVLCVLCSFRPVDQSSAQQCAREFRSLVGNKRIMVKVKSLLDSEPLYFPKHFVEVREKKVGDVLNHLMEAGLAARDVSGKKQGKRPGSGGSSRRGGGRLSNSSGNGSEGRGGERVPQGWGKTTNKSPFSRQNEGRPLPTAEGSAKSPFSRGNEMQSSPTKPPPVSPELPAPDAADYPPLSSLTSSELPSDKEFVEVVVTALSDLPTLFVQLVTVQSHQAISNLQTELNSTHLPPPGPHPPMEGQVVCCKYKVDRVWYRAAVLEMWGSQCVVQFIDYGNKETVPLADLRPCPPHLLKQPILCIKCSLFGVHPPSGQWSPEVGEFLQNYCERVLMAKIKSRDPLSGLPSVQLIDTSSDTGDIFLSSELIRAGLAVPSSPSPALPQPSQLPTATVPLFAEAVTSHPIPLARLPREREFDVLVLSVRSFTEIYIHPVTEDTPHYLSTFMTSISDYCSAQTTPTATPPAVGHYCLARYDGSWYRGRIESLTSASKANVFFVDYGNQDKVPLTQIRPIPAEFADVPRLVVKCALAGVEPCVVLEPDPATCILLTEMLLSSKLTCRVVNYCPLLVELVAPSSGRSLRDELSSSGKLSPLTPLAFFSVEPSCLRDEKEEVFVTEVHGPGDIWVQQEGSPNVAKLLPLMEEIGTHCVNQPVSHTPAVLGQLVCARFSEDGVWYRARVVGFPSLSQYLVRFLDYGNVEEVGVLAVLPVTEELLKLPALAIHCALQGTKEKEGGLEGVVDEDVEFKRQVENKVLSVKVRGWERGKTIVSL